MKQTERIIGGGHGEIPPREANVALYIFDCF